MGWLAEAGVEQRAQCGEKSMVEFGHKWGGWFFAEASRLYSFFLTSGATAANALSDVAQHRGSARQRRYPRGLSAEFRTY